MTAERVHGAMSCGACASVLRAGEVVYRVTTARLARCAACAKAIQADLPKIQATHNDAPKPREVFARFNRGEMAGVVKRNILDWRAKQAGEKPLSRDGDAA